MFTQVIRILLSALALVAASTMPSRAQSCIVTPPSSFNLGSVDVLTSSVVDVQTSINISCTVVAGQEVRLCLSIGDPNGEGGSTRFMINGSNKLYYDLFLDPARTQRWGSWRTGTGNGFELVFTSASSTYSTNVPIYARVYGGQQMVPTQNPALTYTENFPKTVANLYERARYSSTGLTCSSMTTGGGAWANSMNLSASVLYKCIVSGGSLNFGIVSSLSNRIDASTNISLICSNTLPYNIGLDNGLNASTPTTRKMKSGASTINYSLYRDSGRALNWGSTIGTDTLGGVGTAVITSIPIYGRVPVQTTPAAATYTDTVQVTVTY